jgi:hypothetical protein
MINHVLITEKNPALDKVLGRPSTLPCLSKLRQILIDEIVINTQEAKKEVVTKKIKKKK